MAYGLQPLQSLRALGRTRVSDERADVEHRVRTELTTISIASQLLQRDELASSRQRRLAVEILGACQRLQLSLDEWFALDERISAE